MGEPAQICVPAFCLFSFYIAEHKRATTWGRPYGVGTSCAPFRRYEGRNAKHFVSGAPNVS